MVYSVAFSPDGGTIASGSWDGSVRLWNADTGEHLQMLTGHSGGVYSVAFSPDGSTIASGGEGPTIRLWDAHRGRLKGRLDDVFFVKSIAYSPDGGTIASGGFDRTISLWNAETGKLLRTFDRPMPAVNSVAFSPDSNTIAGGVGDGIRLWDTNTGELLRTFTGHTGPVESVAFSPDGHTLASGASWDDTIRLWDANTGELVQSLTGHTLAVRGGTSGIYSVAFSRDCSTLASGSRDGTVLLWDFACSGKLGVKPLETHFATLGNIKRTALLQNYPNPFNPETWIPYQLANDSIVTLNIYDQSGHIVRTLDVGHQVSGFYRGKAEAAYWDGCNQNGEPVTSGAYYYQLRAGDYTTLRRMVVVK